MKMAIEKAWEGHRKGQEPFGACVVKDTQILSISHNTIRSDNDPTAHAEINAIREACINIKAPDLRGCEIYATFLPCDMCMNAIARAGIETVFYGAGPDNVQYPVSNSLPQILGGISFDECLKLAVIKYPKRIGT